MAPTHSLPDQPQPLGDDQRRCLLELARKSIRHGLEYGCPLGILVPDYPDALRRIAASFVTLHWGGQLRGCIGHLEAFEPLVEDVVGNAWSAAFRDPRFRPVTAAEFPGLHIHISVLSPPHPVHFLNEANLLRQIRPGLDGLILADGRHRGTFLPSVWEALPSVDDFWRHLKVKAGLPPDYWSGSLTVQRYHTESFEEPLPRPAR